MRKIAILCLLALIPLTQLDTATADSANPPKITSVQIITPTPAVIGQILTIEVQYSGGAPGIKQLMITSYGMSDGSGAGSCWGGYGWSNSQYPQFQSMTRVTAIVGGGNTDACKDDGKPLTFVAEITDETNLKDRYQFDLRVINPFNRIGTVSQSRATEFNVNNYFPNQTISSYNFPFSLELPRVTPEGIPIVYYGNGDCERLIDFINDTGKGIRFLRPGTCQFTSLFGNLKNISYNISVIDKAAADKAAADKAAADKAAADKAAADKAAADKAAADKAAADKAAADKAAADKAAADKAAADKAAADKAICEANRAKLNALRNDFLKAMKTYPSQAGNMSDTYIRILNALGGPCISDGTLNDFQQESKEVIDKASKLALKPATITCVKGKITKKITEVNPKCPIGYTRK